MLPVDSVLLAAALVVSLLVALSLAARPKRLLSATGKLLALVSLVLFPSLLMVLGGQHHLETSKHTDFCLSCHEMADYGASLWIDDRSYLPAAHYQNRWVSKETACYECHTRYAMFGDLEAKIAGARHLLVHFTGEIPDPIELYEPYQNRECLHCHAAARSYVESVFHADLEAELSSNEVSCLECHDRYHAVGELDELERWRQDPP